MADMIDEVMSNVLFLGMYNQDQTNFYKRSVYSLRGNCSMTESEVQRDLQGTLDLLDLGRDEPKHMAPTETTVISVWTCRRQFGLGCLMSLFFVLVVLNCHHLTLQCSQQYQLINDEKLIRDITRQYITGISLVQEMDCILRMDELDCPHTLERIYEDNEDDTEMVCITQDVLNELQNLRTTSSGNKTMVYKTVSQLIIFVKTCTDKTMQMTVSLYDAEAGSTLVPVAKLIHATFLAFHRFLLLMMHCSSYDTQIDYLDFVTELNFVTGNLDSFFMTERYDFVIFQMYKTKLAILMKILQSNDSSAFCSLNEWTSVISLPLNLKAAVLQSLTYIQDISNRKSNLNIFIVVLYSFLLSCVPVFCVLIGKGLKRTFKVIADLQVREELVSQLLQEEKFEFQSILAEIIPPSKFSEVLPLEELKISEVNVNKQLHYNNHVSFSDSESCDSKPDVVIKRTSQMPRTNPMKLNPYKKPSHVTMATIVEDVPTNNIYGKISKSTSNIEEVTIYCSDIVGFNRLIQHFSPRQITNTVSYLVKLFDDRTKLYDVFVVGRNVNAFTVLSGITSEQKHRHASEIVNMALDIQAVCSDLEFENGPDLKLRMRMAIHTGSCYCSLSSFPTPRFNTSGDIFRDVKRLLKSTTPTRIQVSESTYQILIKNFSYNLQKWETITSNHEQTMKTYQLNGRRVSEDKPPLNGRRTTWTPIELEQKALYRFEADDMKYIPSPAWMIPTRSQSCHSETSHMSRMSVSSIDSMRPRPFIHTYD